MNEAAGDWGHTTDGCLFSLTIAIVTSIHRPRFTWPFSLSSPPPSPAPSPVPSPAPPCARPLAPSGSTGALHFTPASHSSKHVWTDPFIYHLIIVFEFIFTQIRHHMWTSVSTQVKSDGTSNGNRFPPFPVQGSDNSYSWIQAFQHEWSNSSDPSNLNSVSNKRARTPILFYFLFSRSA